MVAGDLGVIPGARDRNIVSGGPRCGFPLVLISLNVVERSLLL